MSDRKSLRELWDDNNEKPFKAKRVPGKPDEDLDKKVTVDDDVQIIEETEDGDLDGMVIERDGKEKRTKFDKDDQDKKEFVKK